MSAEVSAENVAEADVLAQARTWMELDPDHAEELAELLAEAETGSTADAATAQAELTSMFAAPLAFGTAGLRAAEGPGIARMNRVVVRRTAAGLADFAFERIASDPPPKVVIGYDARTGSRSFAEDSAAVFTAAGCTVLLMPDRLPTPLLAFAVRHLNADIGVMVTASHNPAEDNGYKVYLGARLAPDGTCAGAQIAEPVDAEIAACIAARTATGIEPELADDGWQVLDDAIIDHYIHAVLTRVGTFPTLSPTPNPQYRSRLSIVYTPMHGVGGLVFTQLMQAAGFAPLTPVLEQMDPDPTFPTVQFPNPEEPGALDLALSTANTLSGTDLVLAHDPDADRLAVAVPEGSSWRVLSGNEIGLILGAYLMPWLKQHRKACASSIVSASQLAALAAAENVPHSHTLTGFKWISRVPDLGYGYEEAIGFCIAPDIVKDKDGLSAGLVIASLAAQLKAEGLTLTDYLNRIQTITGPVVTDQISARADSPEILAGLMQQLRSNPPETIGALPVTAVRDFIVRQPEVDGRTTDLLILAAAADPVRIELKFRPSGTEPKVKCYIEVYGTPGTDPGQLDNALTVTVSFAQELFDQLLTGLG